MKIDSDTYYHLYNRGNNKGLIFFEDDNYAFFLQQFKKYVSPHCKVFCYCLMPNHFHFFIGIEDNTSFEKGIKNFFISYSKAINKRYNRVGSLFQGRYKVSKIASDSYYTKIISYIHQNPVVAGLVGKLEDYRYSSYSSYLSNKESGVQRTEVIEWFGGLVPFIEHHKIMLDQVEMDKLLK